MRRWNTLDRWTKKEVEGGAMQIDLTWGTFTSPLATAIATIIITYFVHKKEKKREEREVEREREKAEARKKKCQSLYGNILILLREA